MKLTNNQLKEIISNIKDIDIYLSWDHGKGIYENENETIEVAKYSISFDLSIHGDCVKMGVAGFMEEQIYSEPTYSTNIYSISVRNSEGEKLEVIPSKLRSIEFNLLENIIYHE